MLDKSVVARPRLAIFHGLEEEFIGSVGLHGLVREGIAEAGSAARAGAASMKQKSLWYIYDPPSPNAASRESWQQFQTPVRARIRTLGLRPLRSIPFIAELRASRFTGEVPSNTRMVTVGLGVPAIDTGRQ